MARIVAAYRELQIGLDRRSPNRDRAVASLGAVALEYDAAMNFTADQLWPDLPSGPGSTHFPLMYYRLRTIAVSSATPGSALSRRPDQAQRIRTALETLYRTQYNENTQELGNWYVYEIGVPYWLLQSVVALGDRLPIEDRRRLLRPVLRFVADPNRRTAGNGVVETGANRADKALIAVVSGALIGDAARVTAGVDAVTDVVGHGAADLAARVTGGDGFRTDGSFIQHDVVSYSGHYGLVLLSAVAGLVAVTENTSAALPAPLRERFYDSVTDVFAPFMVAGSMMEPVRGRMLSRQGETGHDAGHQLTAAAVLLARSAPEPHRSRLAGSAARWITEGSWAPYLTVTDLGRFSGGLAPVGVADVEYAEQLLADAPPPASASAEHRVFPQMDRMVHRQAGWSASLGLSSTRISRYESINGQNLHGWYVGDGALYLFLPGQQGHYSDAYWPTMDATLVPGTTEKDSTPPALIGKPPPGTGKAFAGGVRFDDGHGAHGLDFVSQDGSLSAKKSWFFTPDAVLCLGAGITDMSGARVRTTIENRNLGEGGTSALTGGGQPLDLTPGRASVLPGRQSWLHLDGVAGYGLLDHAGAPPVTARLQDRTGTWRDIDTGANTHGTDTPYTRRYQQIWLDHGVRPLNASYAYAVLPGASADQTRDALTRWRVLANTSQVQAVALDEDTTAALFFAAATAGPLTVSGPCAVVAGRGTDGWTLTVSDPTQEQQTVRITLKAAGLRLAPGSDPTVTQVSTGAVLTLDVNLTNSQGATHTARLTP